MFSSSCNRVDLGRNAAALLVAVAVLCSAAVAHAIPAFARRYETSCQTCHVAFPKLTPFGEAFRRNAYRFPGNGDVTAEKEEPLGLGNEALKGEWPKSVWPGQMPRNLPLSVVVDGRATFGPTPEEHSGPVEAEGGAMAGMDMEGSGEQRFALGELGGHIGLRAGGSLGDAAAFFASVDVGGHEPIGVERGFVNFTPLGPTLLHVRVGRFEPTLHGVSIHRGLLGHQLRLTTTAVGLSPFVIEPSTTGIELAGTAFGRAGWALGAVENASGGRAWRKDFYGRGEWKLGGMRLDGLHAEAGKAAWSERSVTLGVSGWTGRATIDKDGMADHADDFLRTGVDLHVIFDDFFLDAVVVRERHDQPALDGKGKQTLDQVFAELTWMASAAIFPTARLEMGRLERANTRETRWLASLQATAVVRANLLVRASADLGGEPGHGTDFRSVVLSFASAF